MLFAESFAAADTPVAGTLCLPYDARRKSRQRVTLTDGQQFGYLLPAGTVLRDGDRLLTGCGRAVVVEAAPEALLEVRAADSFQLMRAAYHLGNRHVAVEVRTTALRLQRDHVLAEMLVGLGCTVVEVEAPFAPEGGAYGAQAHGGSAPAADDHHHSPHDPGHGAHRSPARIHEFK